MQVNFDSYTDEFKTDFKQHLAEIWAEIRQLLPSIPKLDEMTFWFNNSLLVNGMKTGGFALNHYEIVLAAVVDKSYNELTDEIESALYHEAFHLANHATGIDNKLNQLSAIEVAVAEGAACVFEITHTNFQPHYSKYDQGFIDSWLHVVTELGADWSNNHRKWMFWDPDSNTHHILYRVGAYIVDQAVDKSGIPVEKLAQLSVKDIAELAQLDL